MKHSLPLLLAVLLLQFSAAVLAQAGAWTVQVMALRDYREAQNVVASLAALGFDAYSDFAMRDGEQFVRVRVGCFAGRDGADTLAAAMASVVTGEAVAVPLEPGAAIQACVEVEIGFLTHIDWRQTAAGAGHFEVEIGGETALLTYTGQRWQVLQESGAAPTPGPAAASLFAQVSANGLPMVQARTPSGPFNLCPGRLLAEVADAVIVERNDAVVACRLLTPAGSRP